MDDKVKVIKIMYANLKRWHKNNYNLVLLMIYFIFTTIQIYNNEYYTADAWFIMSSGLAVLICIMGYAHEQLMKENRKKVPVLKGRMTIRLDDAVYVNKDDWEKAIMYLADVEDYLEKQGVLK